MMSTINSYILRQTAKPLVAAILIALLILLAERMLRLLDLVLDSRGSLTALMRLLAFLIPHYMALALPAAFFLGILLAFSRLHERSELDACGATGIGLTYLLRPVLALALLLTVISALSFSVLQPVSRYTYRALLHDVTETSLSLYLQEGVFMEVSDTSFMAEKITQGGRQFHKIFIYENKGDGSTLVTTAERGRLAPGPNGGDTLLVLENGVRLQTGAPPGNLNADLSRNDGALTFTRTQMELDLGKRKLFRARGKDERELTLPELWRSRDNPPANVRIEDLLAEFNNRTVRILTVFFLPFLAIPFAIGGRRVHRVYGIATGLLLLVVYNEVLNAGSALVAAGHVGPALGQWLPFALFAGGSVMLFRRTAQRVPRGIGPPLALRRLEQLCRRAVSALSPARRESG